MSTLYATISTKGQVTLPAEFRRELGLHPGQKVGMTVDDNKLVIVPPPSLEEVRAQLRAAAEAAGTWGRPYKSGDGWAAEVKEKYGQP